jgi:hypothetical protein
MRGGNGELWEVVKVGTTHRWVPHEEMLRFDADEIRVVRSNSWIIPKRKSDLWMEVGTRGTFRLSLSSIYVPEANMKIETTLSHMKIGLGHCDGIRFFYNKIFYVIFITSRRARAKLTQYKAVIAQYARDYQFPLSDSLPVTREHHLGTLVMLTPKIIKSLPHKYYYVVIGQNAEYPTSPNIHVWKNVGLKYRQGNYLEFDTYTLHAGKMMVYDALVRNERGYICTGGGDDPIHIVVDLRKTFKPPAILPPAERHVPGLIK